MNLLDFSDTKKEGFLKVPKFWVVNYYLLFKSYIDSIDVNLSDSQCYQVAAILSEYKMFDKEQDHFFVRIRSSDD